MPNTYEIFKNYGEQETFTCDLCFNVFEKAWSDEEALAEMRRNYKRVDTSDTLILCDQCLTKLQLGLSSDIE